MGVFLLSPGLLPEITRAVKMYPRLQGIRWFVRDAMLHEEALREDAAATRHESILFQIFVLQAFFYNMQFGGRPRQDPPRVLVYCLSLGFFLEFWKNLPPVLVFS